MRIRHTYLHALFAATMPFVLLSAIAVSSPSLLPVPSCAATGLGPGGQNIRCSGGCSTGKCESEVGSDSVSPYKYCKCSGQGATESPCCHLVARNLPEETDPSSAFDTLDVRGLCTNTEPDCADSDGLMCKLVSSQPLCQTPPPNGDN